MKLVYRPKDGSEPQEWQIDANDLTIGEAKKLEQVTGMTMNEIGEQMDKGSFTVMIAFLWLFRRRTQPDLKMTAFDSIRLSELEMQADDDEGDEGDPKDSTPTTAEQPAKRLAVAESA